MFTLLSNWTCDHDFVLTEKERSHKRKLPARIFSGKCAKSGGAFTFYCHSAKEGKKLDVIRKNASVAFEMDCQNALQHGETACTHSYYYASVLGEGKAEILEGERNVLYALNCIKPPITLVMRPPSLYQRNRRFSLLPKLLSFKKTVCRFCQNTLNSPRASGSSPPYRLK